MASNVLALVRVKSYCKNDILEALVTSLELKNAVHFKISSAKDGLFDKFTLRYGKSLTYVIRPVCQKII